MSACPKCGAQINESAQFCGACGAAKSGNPSAMGTAGGGVPASATAAAAGQENAGVPAGAPAKAMTSNVAGLVAYVLGFVTGIFLLITEPYKGDRFVRFHALQSIFVSGVYLAIVVLWSMLSGIFFGTSFFAMWRFIYLTWWVIRLVFFALWLFLMYKAYNNERFELPIVGPIAAKHAGYGS